MKKLTNRALVTLSLIQGRSYSVSLYIVPMINFALLLQFTDAVSLTANSFEGRSLW